MNAASKVGKPKKLVVIGGGVGGYTAAIRAARAGLEVTLVERGELGGTCLNVGCIPTKSLLHQAQVFREAGTLGHFGVDPAGLSVAMGAVMGKKDEAVKKLVQGVNTLVRRNRISLVKGTAEFVDGKTVRIRETGALLVADAVIIASGSEPVLPPIAGVALEGVVTSDGALAIGALPKRVLIVGGGVIGVEFAQIFNDFRVEVTVVEKLERLVAEATTVANRQPNVAANQFRLALAQSYLAEVALELRDKGAARGAAETGIQAAQKLVALDAKSAPNHSLLGTLCAQVIPANVLAGLKYGRCALDEINKAIELDPKYPEAWLRHGVGNYYLPAQFGGGTDLAIKDFEKAIQLNPKLSEAYLWMGVAMRKVNRNAEARKAFQKAVELNPRRVWAKQQLEKTPAK